MPRPILPLLIASTAIAIPAAAQPADPVRSLALEIAGAEARPIAKARLVIDWLNRNFEWTATDYAKRSVEEIVLRKGGNCAEQMRVARALLAQLGVRTRRMAEINLQPFSAGRGRDAAAMIADQGVRASVFGAGHNDHRWVEIYDPAQDEWVPADPTLGLLGVDQWVAARVGFGARPIHAILPSRDMIVPVAVFALSDEEGYANVVDRSRYYLVDRFAALYGERLQRDPAWADWVAEIDQLRVIALGAFRGSANLHDSAALLEQTRGTYARLARDMGG